MSIQYIDSLDKHLALCKTLPAVASPDYKTINRKQYRYIGTKDLERSFCWKAQRILLLATIALATLLTLGLCFLHAPLRLTAKNVCNDIATDKIHYYALNTLQNWCLLKHTKEKIKLTEKFSIKKFWDKDLLNQWWNGKITSSDLHALHDKMIKGRNVPTLIKDVPLNKSVSSIEAVGLLANYLSKKTGETQFFVCKNLQVFQKEIEKIKNTNEDKRLVLITPTFFSLIDPDKKSDCELHNVSVCIEKKNGKMKVCLLDSTPYVVKMEQVNLDKGDFSSQDLVFSYMRAAQLPNDTQFYTPYVKLDAEGKTTEGNRQFTTQGGCAVFALRDAIGYLQDKKFFEKLDRFLEKQDQNKKGKGTVTEPFFYRTLPPNFMKITQSMRKLEKYISENGELTKELLGKAKITISESIEKHKRSINGKTQNWLISHRVLKYQMLCLFLLNHTPDDEFNTMINSKLKSKV